MSSATSSTSSIYDSSSRITGIFSDMDTDSIVKSMCSRQQSKIDEKYQKQQTYQWTEDAWDDINGAVKEFENTYASVLGSSSMLKNSTYVKFSVTSSDTTSSAVSVKAGSTAAASSVSVSVSQLAVQSNVSSSGVSALGESEISSSNSAALSDLSFANALQFDIDGNISFSINGKEFSFSSDTTLQNMISTVNADSDANVTMTYSRLTDGFTITADSGGAGSKVTIKNISGNAFGENSAFGIPEGTKRNGQNAIATINYSPTDSSKAVTVEKGTNEFTIDGLTYELNSTTSSATTFTINRDFSSTVDAVSTMVDAFNTLLTKLTSYNSAKDNSDDYPPLTEAQKDEMDDDEIEKWETKAKSGLLRHNSTLESLINELKSAFYTSAGGTGNTGTSIGLTTASYYSSNAGSLTINENTLKEALASNSDQVIAIFIGGSSSSASSDQGIIYKMRSTMSNFLSTSDDIMDDYSDKIDTIDDDIDHMEDKLSDLAEKYYNQFSEMETALSKLNGSANMISSMFS